MPTHFENALKKNSHSQKLIRALAQDNDGSTKIMWLQRLQTVLDAEITAPNKPKLAIVFTHFLTLEPSLYDLEDLLEDLDKTEEGTAFYAVKLRLYRNLITLLIHLSTQGSAAEEKRAQDWLRKTLEAENKQGKKLFHMLNDTFVKSIRRELPARHHSALAYLLQPPSEVPGSVGIESKDDAMLATRENLLNKKESQTSATGAEAVAQTLEQASLDLALLNEATFADTHTRDLALKAITTIANIFRPTTSDRNPALTYAKQNLEKYLVLIERLRNAANILKPKQKNDTSLETAHTRVETIFERDIDVVTMKTNKFGSFVSELKDDDCRMLIDLLMQKQKLKKLAIMLQKKPSITINLPDPKTSSPLVKAILDLIQYAEKLKNKDDPTAQNAGKDAYILGMQFLSLARKEAPTEKDKQNFQDLLKDGREAMGKNRRVGIFHTLLTSIANAFKSFFAKKPEPEKEKSANTGGFFNTTRQDLLENVEKAYEKHKRPDTKR